MSKSIDEPEITPRSTRSEPETDLILNLPGQENLLQKAVNFFKSEPKEIQELCKDLNDVLKKHDLIVPALDDQLSEVRKIAEAEYQRSFQEIVQRHAELNHHVKHSPAISKQTQREIENINHRVSEIQTHNSLKETNNSHPSRRKTK